MQPELFIGRGSPRGGTRRRGAVKVQDAADVGYGKKRRSSPMRLSRPYRGRLPLPGREHRAHPFDSTFTCLACFRAVDPGDEVPARVRRQAAPSGLRPRCRREGCAQIRGHGRLVLLRFDSSERATLEQTRAAIGRWIDARAVGGPMFANTLRRPSGLLVGGCEVRRSAPESANVSYRVFPEFRNQGYATATCARRSSAPSSSRSATPNTRSCGAARGGSR